MEYIFLTIYHFFKIRRNLFWILTSMLVAFMIFSVTKLKFEEDISKVFPNNPEVKKISEILQHTKMAERLVIMFSQVDSTEENVDRLVEIADRWAVGMEDLDPFVSSVSTTVDESVFLTVLDTIHQYLPVFLEEEDYAVLDSWQDPETVRNILQQQYQQLLSPSGIGVKRIIQNDPLGLKFLVLKRMQQLYVDDSFELYDGYVVTKDHKHLLCFVVPQFPNSDTGNNTKFISALDSLMIQVNGEFTDVQASYFGGTAVAVGNATQLRDDTKLTVSLMVVALIVLLLGYFRRKRVAFYILLPVMLGCLFSLSIVYWYQGSLSIIALAVGAVILGVAVNYSLHYLVDLRHAKSTTHVIETLAKPLTIGSATTILAFFALRFTQAPMLQDVGLFAGLSLLGAALSSLIVLPQIVSEDIFNNQKSHFIDRVITPKRAWGKYMAWGIILLTPFFYYQAKHVSFNSNMMELNFMKSSLKVAQDQLKEITKQANGAIYVVSSGATMEQALRRGEQSLVDIRESLKNTPHKISSVHEFLLSDSIQQIRLARWNDYWTNEKVEKVLSNIHEEGEAIKFSIRWLTTADSLLLRTYKPYNNDVLSHFQDLWFGNYQVTLFNETSLITMVQVDRSMKDMLKSNVNASVEVFDQQQITETFVTFVKEDFNYIVWITGSIVFIALLIVYGRIELTLLTFVPMMITWIWILGIMALVGIEFNIINIMVSTFIFGLGDDYSIFTMDGLLEEYRAAKENLASVRISVLLSALTTIVGLGVLIFAEHPALRSIAFISIIGIVSVYIMAQTLQPFFFRLLITNRTKKKLPPVTAVGFFASVMLYSIFIVGSLALSVLGLLLKLIPISRERKKRFYHRMIASVTGFLVHSAFPLTRRLEDYDKSIFDSSSIIIANHTSFLDILFFTMLHPKLVLVTNRWVYRSPIFGGVVRMANYITVEEGVGETSDKIKSLIQSGYSIVIFPEGTRAATDKMGRFHKGAFYLSEVYQLPIIPVLIHGAGNCISKGDFYVNTGVITMKFLPSIAPDDEDFGNTYSERTKRISKYFKEAFLNFKNAMEQPRYFEHHLMNNFRYKGPVLEWYLRVKVRLEKYYAIFDSIIPKDAKVLDLGCGYGFMGYMLQFLSEDRTIVGVDYDRHKIETAQHGYLRSSRLSFQIGDVTECSIEGYDAIVISDVLHYLSYDKQEVFIKRCLRALPSHGKLIIRDGDADLKERHKGTKLTEWFSIKLLKFNKAEDGINFLSGSQVERIAHEERCVVERIDDTTYTSNVIFVIQKQENREHKGIA